MFDIIIRLKNNKTNTILPSRASAFIKSAGEDFKGFTKREDAGKWMHEFKKQMNKQKEVSVVSFKVTDDIAPDVEVTSRYGDKYKFIYVGDENWIINFGEFATNIYFNEDNRDVILGIDPPGGLINGGPLEVGQRIPILHNKVVDKIVYAAGSYVISMKDGDDK